MCLDDPKPVQNCSLGLRICFLPPNMLRSHFGRFSKIEFSTSKSIFWGFEPSQTDAVSRAANVVFSRASSTPHARVKVQKWPKMTISTFFFKMFQKCSRCVQMIQNRSRTVLWVSEYVFLPPNMLRSHFWTFFKNRFFDLKIGFLGLGLSKG